MAYNKRKHLKKNIDALRAEFDSHLYSHLPKDHLISRAKSVMRDFSGFGGLKCVLNPAEKDSDIEQ